MKPGQLCKTWLLVVMLAGCGSFDHPVENKVSSLERFRLNSRTGELEGFESINTLIKNRVLDPAQPVTREFAIEAVGGPGILEVREMLGGYGTEGDRNEFLHGEPNPFSAMLWQNQFGTLAQSLGRACDESGRIEDVVILPGVEAELAFTLHPRLLSILQTICLSPADQGQSPENLEKLWLQVMSYDAPQEEVRVWQDFFLRQDLTWTTRGERLSALFFTLFMNPYFILQE